MSPQSASPAPRTRSHRLTRRCLAALLALLVANAWAVPAQWGYGAARAAASLSISPSLASSGAAGTTQSQAHSITNNSPLPQTFNLSVESRQSWAASVSPSQVQIAPGASKSVTVQVTIPSDAPPGTLGLTTLTATNVPPAAPTSLQIRDTLLVTGTAALKVPPVQMGALVGGQRTYALTEARGTTSFLPGVQTPTAGYNGTFLGPTLVFTKEERIALSVTNNLTEVTTTHWHGLHLPGQMDGGPHQPIEPGETWRPTFTVINEASTAWYHPHPHTAEMDHATNAEMAHPMVTESGATTGHQVYAGLAGMIIIRDSASEALGLPHTYGGDEFPVVVQDRNFDADGSFSPYPEIQDRDLHKGDHFLVNGTLAGTLSAPAQMVRLHLLNGSNARFYNFGFSDSRSFYQIASDNALLNQRVSRNRVVLGPGERAEIVVDLSGAQGQTLHFLNYAAEFGPADVAPTSVDDYDQANYILFSINVAAATTNAVTTIPATLNHIARTNPNDVPLARTLTLNIPPSINGGTFEMEVVNITATLGTKEVWTIVNLSEETHPFHIHDSPFQIVSRNGAAPPEYEQGLKDTVLVHALERVVLIKDFSGYADAASPFMYHCHILDHEDKGMMGQFIIVDGRSVYLPVVTR